MIKQLCKVVMLSTILLTIFDRGGVGSAYAANQGVYRGDYAVIEVDENSPMTAIPDTGTWYNGQLNTDPQQYDVLVAARGNISTAQNPTNDLIVTPYEIPDFFETKNGKLLVAEPKPMGTITMPKGNNRGVDLYFYVTDDLSDQKKHTYIGVRKQGESAYMHMFHGGKKSSTVYNLPLFDSETLELVPLLSKSASEYIAIEPGTEYPPEDSDYKPSGQFDFSSAFRIACTISESIYMLEQNDFPFAGNSDNYGRLGIGPVTTQTGEVYCNQLVAISLDGSLARSPDGIHWFSDMGKIPDLSSPYMRIAPTYGNGMWCVVVNQTAKRSIDGGKSWLDADIGCRGECEYLEFGNGIFMTVDNNSEVYTSENAVKWTSIGNVGAIPIGLIYGNNRLLVFCVSKMAIKNGEEDWKSVKQMSTEGGICYANGYFYNDYIGYLYYSKDGENWEKMHLGYSPHNLTYYKNRLLTLEGNSTVSIIDYIK